jgi:hypothetical protein
MATATKNRYQQAATSTPKPSSSSDMPSTAGKSPANKVPHHADAKTHSQPRKKGRARPKMSAKNLYRDYGLITRTLIRASLHLFQGGNLKSNKQTSLEANKGGKK